MATLCRARPSEVSHLPPPARHGGPGNSLAIPCSGPDPYRAPRQPLLRRYRPYCRPTRDTKRHGEGRSARWQAGVRHVLGVQPRSLRAPGQWARGHTSLTHQLRARRAANGRRLDFGERKCRPAVRRQFTLASINRHALLAVPLPASASGGTSCAIPRQ